MKGVLCVGLRVWDLGFICLGLIYKVYIGIRQSRSWHGALQNNGTRFHQNYPKYIDMKPLSRWGSGRCFMYLGFRV